MTARQYQTIEFIRGFIDEHGWPPTLREIAAGLGVSVSTVNERLDSLERQGRIQRAKFAARGIRVLHKV